MNTILDTALKLPVFGKGKVRDTYITGNHLLMIATDRISAFDVVLPTGIPDKGIVLNQLSVFWFGKTYHIVHNHLVESVESRRALSKYTIGKMPLPEWLRGRSMVVLKAERIPVECVVRGYISGSAWAEYKKSGTISGRKAPSGLIESQQLPEPLFTPTTKADAGHDIPLKPKQLIDLVGEKAARKLEEKSLALYIFARDYAMERGIIIADTKFEFGYYDRELILIDEALTPDSSRFWDAGLYEPGQAQPSYDKQPVRDWLVKSRWDKKSAAPALPPAVIEATAERYRDAYYFLTGRKLKNVYS
ncbi:MAG: phosphoribosylaminoimidazolesuccinocarboxamide synthase [Chloroflexi bacterium]|nr:phosphoribosylaminoimidazolesuccinocarboxamide synthase [Chloroflexota bacterium]